jgi:hypothetical protein
MGGFILITVLLISTLFLGATVAYAVFAKREMKRASDEEFALVSRGAAMMAFREASNLIASDTGESDSVLEPLYSGGALNMGFGDFSAAVTITPLGGKIPLRDIFLPDGTTLKNEYQYAWGQIWGRVGTDASKIAPIALDFMDTDKSARPGSREGGNFPNRPVSDLGELLWIPEITRGLLYAGVSSDAALDVYFTALDAKGVNINIAPMEVLTALDPSIRSDVAESIIAYRASNEIKNESDLRNVAGLSSTVAARLKNVLHYKSELFMVRIEVSRGTSSRAFEAITKRGGGGSAMVCWRE